MYHQCEIRRIGKPGCHYAILDEKEGVFSFRTGISPQQMKAAEIGDSMSLLMEGVKRVDEKLDLN